MIRFKLALVSLAFLVSVFAQQSQAFAGAQWCSEDPVFLVNGSIVDITTVFDAKHMSKVKGAVNFDLQIPSNAVAVALSLPGDVPVTASIRRTLPANWSLLTVPVVLTVTMDTSGQSFETYTKVTGTAGKIFTSFSGDAKWGTKANFKMYGVGLL
jgi:hypothetical protein